MIKDCCAKAWRRIANNLHTNPIKKSRRINNNNNGQAVILSHVPHSRGAKKKNYRQRLDFPQMQVDLFRDFETPTLAPKFGRPPFAALHTELRCCSMWLFFFSSLLPGHYFFLFSRCLSLSPLCCSLVGPLFSSSFDFERGFAAPSAV